MCVGVPVVSISMFVQLGCGRCVYCVHQDVVFASFFFF